MWYLQYQLGDILAASSWWCSSSPSSTGCAADHGVRVPGGPLRPKTRLLGSTLFSLTVLLRAGTLLFGAALLFSAVVPTDLIPGLTGWRRRW
jgi:hypothetical protein